MGIRESQPQGLPPAAEDYLKKYGIKVNYCPHCQRDGGLKKDEIGTTGMFGDVPLWRYYLDKMPGVTHADEFVQECVWDSGPMEWFGLRLSNGTEIKWSEEELKAFPELGK